MARNPDSPQWIDSGIASAVTAIISTDHAAIWALVIGWLGWLVTV